MDTAMRDLMPIVSVLVTPQTVECAECGGRVPVALLDSMSLCPQCARLLLEWIVDTPSELGTMVMNDNTARPKLTWT